MDETNKQSKINQDKLDEKSRKYLLEKIEQILLKEGAQLEHFEISLRNDFGNEYQTVVVRVRIPGIYAGDSLGLKKD